MNKVLDAQQIWILKSPKHFFFIMNSKKITHKCNKYVKYHVLFERTITPKQ